MDATDGSTNVSRTPPGWRALYPPHPCADTFPLMADDELNALAADIKAHGLRQPITLWNKQAGDPLVVLDGRNRLDALTRLGVTIPPLPSGVKDDTVWPGQTFQYRNGETDPAAFVISANIHRRHLTKAQQADLIVAAVAAGRRDEPAAVARSFSPVSGQKGGSTSDPVLATAVAEGAKHGISKRTIQRARQRVQSGPRQPAPTARAQPITPVTVGRPSDVSVATFLANLRREITKQRKANHDATALLDWIERQLERITTAERRRTKARR